MVRSGESQLRYKWAVVVTQSTVNLRKQYVLSGAAMTVEFDVDSVELATDSRYACEISVYLPSTLDTEPSELDYRSVNGAAIEDVAVVDGENTQGTVEFNFDVEVEQNNQRSAVNFTHPAFRSVGASIPSASGLVACQTAVEQELTGDDLHNLLDDHYSYHSFRQYTRFLGDLHRTLPLEEYIEVADRAVERFPSVVDVFDRPERFLAENLLEYGRTPPARSFETIEEIAAKYDEAASLPSVTPEEVVEYAVCKRAVDNDTVAELDDLHQRFLSGDPWHELVSESGLVYIISALVGNEAASRAVEVAHRSPPEYTDQTYDRKKRGAKQANASDRAHRWAQLVPASAVRSRGEFRYVLANATYWSAQSLTEDTRFIQASAYYAIAAELFDEVGVDLMARKARARVAYSKGVEMLHRDKNEQAQTHFQNVYDVAVSESKPDLMFLRLKAIRHSLAAVLNQAREVGFDGVRGDVESYFGQYPAEGEVDSGMSGLYEGVGSYLIAAREECLAAEAETRDETLKHLERAVDAFEESRSRYDVMAVEEKLKQYRNSAGGTSSTTAEG